MSSLPDELPISDARDHLTDVVARATYTGQITYITKRGRRVGAIVPVDVAEAAEAGEDEYLSGLVREAEAELAAGTVSRPLGEVLAELDLGPGETDETSAKAPRPRTSADDANTRQTEPRPRA